MAGTRGHIVQTTGKKKPYKAVLEHEQGDDTERPVATIREGEAFIRHETPTPQKRDTSRDHKAPNA